MTTEQEAELVKLLAEATPRPWASDDNTEWGPLVWGADRTLVVADCEPVGCDSAPEAESVANSRLIPTAVNLLPALLEERRALKEALTLVLDEDRGSVGLGHTVTPAERVARAALALAARPVGE